MEEKKKFKKLYDFVESVCDKIENEAEKSMFKQCYLSTLETTVDYCEKDVFIKTGDIPAMWLRDSSVQVSHYVRLVQVDEDVDRLIRMTLARQFKCILIDPYANAFNREANNQGHKDITKQNPNVWERKYEIDSLVYPLWLTVKYFKYKKDVSVFDNLFFEAFKTIVDLFILEQRHDEFSEYSFVRTDENWYDSLENDGRGRKTAYTGMTWSAFRPSDDRCEYHYLVPSNMFIVAVFKKILKVFKENGVHNPYQEKCEKMILEIEDGIQKYAVIDTEEFGKIYAYEVDGYGNKLLMDDANVPSLLSLPYLGYCEIDDEIYQNTRKFILSKQNPYYFEGSVARGIGSPHTPTNYIWHIALIMQALTSKNEEEIKEMYHYLQTTHAKTFYMHEAFHCDKPEEFTRPWFAWANTLYAIFIIDYILKKQ